MTYSDISPTAAVAIFSEMDETICAKLLSQMKPDKVAAILQEMSAEDKDETMVKRAARISDKLRLCLLYTSLKLMENYQAGLRNRYPQIEFRADPDLQPGDCIVTSRFGALDGRLATKLRSVDRILQ